VLGVVGENVTALGNDTAGSAVRAITHQAVKPLGGVMYPGIDVGQQGVVDGCCESKGITVPVEIPPGSLFVVPIDEVFRHPGFQAFGLQFFETTLDVTVLMAGKIIQLCQHAVVVERVDIIVRHAHAIGSHDLAIDQVSVAFDEGGHLVWGPDASMVRGAHVRFVLNRYGLQINTVSSQVSDVVVQVIGVIRIMLFFQVTDLFHSVGIRIDGSDVVVGFPFGRHSPGAGEDNQPQRLGQFGRSQRLAPTALSLGNIQAHDVVAGITGLAPDPANLRF